MDALIQSLPATVSVDIQLGVLATQYEFRNADEVRSHLGSRLELINVLLEAHKKIEEIFGENTGLILDLVHFHDFPDSRELFIRILTPLTAESAYSLLIRLDDEWTLGKDLRSIAFTLDWGAQNGQRIH